MQKKNIERKNFPLKNLLKKIAQKRCPSLLNKNLFFKNLWKFWVRAFQVSTKPRIIVMQCKENKKPTEMGEFSKITKIWMKTCCTKNKNHLRGENR